MSAVPAMGRGTSPAGQSHGQVETGPMVAPGTEVGGPQALVAAVCLHVPGTDQRQYPLLTLVVSLPLRF